MLAEGTNELDERDHVLSDEHGPLIRPLMRSTRRKDRSTYHFHSNKNPDQSYISQESVADDQPLSAVPRPENTTKLIRMTRPFRIRWDLFTMLLALYNCLTVPIFVAFYTENSLEFFFVNTTIDLVFIVDIILNFYTTYIDRNGDEVIVHRKVIVNYLKGFFWLDLVASVPIDNFYVMFNDARDESGLVQLTDLLKLVRILRLGRIIRFTRTRDDVKTAMKLLQLTLYLVMWVHFTGCVWFLMVKIDQEWIPVPDFGAGTTELYDADVWTQYFTSFYHAVWLLTGGEVGPTNSAQAFVASLLIIIGALITAVLFGEMAVLMSNLNRRQTQFQEILDGALTTMNNMNLPESLTNRILDYITSTQSSLSQQAEYETFQKHISPSLQQKVSACIYDPILRMNYTLQDEEELTKELVNKLLNSFFKPEEDIIVQGRKGECLYFLVDGECKVFVNNRNQNKAPVCYLYPGAHFGEISVVYNTLRTATVVGSGYCTIAELSGKDFQALVTTSPTFLTRLRRCTEVYQDDWKMYLLEIMGQQHYFRELPIPVFNELVYFLNMNRLNKNQYLFRPAESTRSLYLVTEGELELSITINERHLHLLKQKTKMSDIEKGPTLPRKTTSLLEYPEIYMLDIAEIDDLKPKADIVPFFSHKGVAGYVRLEEEVPNDTQSVGDYPQEIVVARLGPGTLLNSNCMLVKDLQQLQCKALTDSVVYSLSSEKLEELCRDHTDFKRRLSKRRVKLQSRSANNTLNVLDFYNSASSCARYRWKFAIVTVILWLREERKKGSSQLANMVTKLQAIVVCEEAGNFDLAEKVLKGHISPHCITEDGCLDPAASRSELNDSLPRTHSVIRTFKNVFDSVNRPSGALAKQYSEIEKSLSIQQLRSREIDQQLADLNFKMLQMIEKLGVNTQTEAFQESLHVAEEAKAQEFRERFPLVVEDLG